MSYRSLGDSVLFKDIEGDSRAGLIQEYMGAKTGESTVPRIFIDGQCHGGGSDLSNLDHSGELRTLLKKAGAIA